MSQPRTAVNKTQWGTITIVTGDNFTVFETQAKKALAIARMMATMKLHAIGTSGLPMRPEKKSSGSAYPGLPTKAVKSYIAIESALISRKLDTYWKIDSGASQHFSGNKNDFLNFTKWTQTQLVSTANGSAVESTGYGDCKVGNLLLQNVWLVPSFNVALISVRQLG
ncbi:hypothetical protein K3495_g15548 [Podosphaera aphanis]|nr:hypothetical protein K3495_g15548 [Podosphaera aphanis]